jgi:hypothetical protein
VTDHRPPACHYDRQLGERVTRNHRDDCPTHTGGTCPGRRGCTPCTAPHCVVCGHEHATNDHPLTCPACLGKIREDLDTIPPAFTALTVEAYDGGRDGRLVAAAPIPGGNAQVLIGPYVRLNLLRTGSLAGMRTFTKDHKASDPIPPLAILAQWEDLWRGWLDHATTKRATVANTVAYLTQQLGYMSQQTGGGVPDWVAFTRQIRTLRARLEHALHDEREPERGVECFECGDRLVRRFRDARLCRHQTPARVELQTWLARRNTAQDWLRVLGSYPETGGPDWREMRDAAAPSAQLLADARRPCEKCAAHQGGIDDPTAGMSWECPGCRKEYSPGEYATAVRRDLMENGAEGDGWTHITMAADAASTMTGHTIAAPTVRQWISREKVASKVDPRGARLVYWPDVADEAVKAVARAVEAAAERRRKAELEERLWSMVAAGEKPRAAGKRLGIRRARVLELCQGWADEGLLEYRRSPDLGWAVDQVAG